MISRIARDGRRRHGIARVIDDLLIDIIRRGRAALFKDIVNRQSKNIPAIVDAGNIFTRADRHGQALGMIEDIALGRFVRIVVDSRAKVRRAGFGGEGGGFADFIMVDSIGILIHPPNGIEDIGVNLVHGDGSAVAPGRFGSVFVGVPAQEFIALAGNGDVFADGMLLILVEHHRAAALTAVGIIDQGQLLVHVAIDGGQRQRIGIVVQKIFFDDNRAVREIALASLILPADKDLLALFQMRAILNVSVGILRVLFAIGNRRALAAVQSIRDGILRAAGKVGIESDILIDERIEVEGMVALAARRGRPAEEAVVALRDNRIRQSILVDFFAVVYHQRNAAVAALHGDIVFRLHRGRVPLGIDGDVKGGHCPPAEGIVLRQRRIGAPAAKRIAVRKARRARGNLCARS